MLSSVSSVQSRQRKLLFKVANLQPIPFPKLLVPKSEKKVLQLMLADLTHAHIFNIIIYLKAAQKSHSIYIKVLQLQQNNRSPKSNMHNISSSERYLSIYHQLFLKS